MKVIQINFVCSTGSTGNIAKSIHLDLIRNGYESLILYGRKSVEIDENTYKFCTESEAYLQSLLLRLGVTLEYGGCNFSTWKLIGKLKEERPDVVHLHCLNGSCVNIYELLRFLGKNKIKTVVTHHAEFYYTGSCPHAYDCLRFVNQECVDCPTPRAATRNRFGNRAHEAWKKMRDAFTTFKKENLIFVAVSPWVKERSLLSPIVNKYICQVVLNGVDTTTFCRQVDRSLIKRRIKTIREYSILFVSASFIPTHKLNNKGGWFIVELAKRMPNVSFIVVTPVARNIGKLPDNVYVWGRATSSQELAKLYSSVDLALIASRRETFSMVLAESLCCGTPVVGFKAGGPESIALEEYCLLVDYGDINMYEVSVKQMLSRSFDREDISSKAKRIYDSSSMSQKYIEIYKRMLHKNN